VGGRDPSVFKWGSAPSKNDRGGSFARFSAVKGKLTNVPRANLKPKSFDQRSSLALNNSEKWRTTAVTKGKSRVIINSSKKDKDQELVGEVYPEKRKGSIQKLMKMAETPRKNI